MPKPANKISDLHSVLQESGKMFQTLREWGSELGITYRDSAKQHAATLQKWNDLSDRLLSNSKDVLAEAQKLFKLGANATAEDVQKRIIAEINDTLATIKKSKAFKRIEELMYGASSQATKENWSIRSAGHKVRNAITNHEQWIENTSPGARLAFGAGCASAPAVCSCISAANGWGRHSTARD